MDRNKIVKKIKSNIQHLSNSPINRLQDASGIYNIPKLKLSTNKNDLKLANKCNKPLPIDDDEEIINDHYCIQLCLNSNAKHLEIGETENVIYDSTLLKSGHHYCYIGQLPKCNLNTTIAIMTINSITCRTKYPNMFGGNYGNNIIACNNYEIYDPRNVLWDAKYNLPADPYTTIINNEDELLSDGTYRFYCKFNGLDSKGNKYIKHPYKRFHPFKNYCSGLVTKAHNLVKLKVYNNQQLFHCDCGAATKSRLKNINPHDVSSQCSPMQMVIEDLVKSKKKLTIPYKCFTLFSTIDEITKYPPCPSEQFLTDSVGIATVNIEFTEHENAIIEHPAYEEFVEDENSGTLIKKYSRIYY